MATAPLPAKLVMPQSLVIVDIVTVNGQDQGVLRPEWVQYLSRLSRMINDLSVRVTKLENP